MADDIVKVMRIDTGDSEQSVKGLRQEIKDLRDSILNLTEGTEGYKKAVDKLQDDQRKLDKVMSLTKKTATALEGSYDDLVQKMSLLKSEWRKTNDEAKRAKLGKQIADINTQLKAMDEEIGNYQRNVGNYTNSIIDAFEELNHSVDEWKNKAADAWEKGDIEEYTKAIEEAGKAQAKVEKIEQDLETSTPTLEKNFQALTDTASGLAGGFEVVQSIMILTGNESENFEKVMIKVQATMAIVQGLQGVGGLIKGLKGLRTAIKAVSASIKTSMATNPVGWIMLAVGAVTGLVTALVNHNRASKEARLSTKAMADEQERLNRTIRNTIEWYSKLTSTYESYGNNPIEAKRLAIYTLQKDLETFEKKITESSNKINNVLSESSNKQKGRDIFIKSLNEGMEKKNKGEVDFPIESFTEKVKNKGAFSEDYLRTGQATFENAYDSLALYIPKYKAVKEELKKIQGELYGTIVDTQNEINRADAEWIESQKSVYQQMLDRHEEEKKLYEDAGMDTKVLLQRQAQEIKDYWADLIDDIYEETANMEIPEEPFEIADNIDLKEDKKPNLKAGLNYRNGINDLEARQKMLDERNRLLEKGVNDEKAWAEMEYNNTLEAEQKKYDTIREYWEKANGPEKLELYEQMKEQELEIDELTYERKKELRDADLAEEAEVMSQKQELFQNSLSLLSTVVKGMGDLYQQDLDNQLAAGKISDEAYDEQFKKVKAMQIAEATINTIAGALGAFMGITKDTGGWGIAVAALQAAAVAATGSFEIAKIAKTEAGAHAVQSGMVQPPANIFNESQPKPVTNITGLKQTEELNKSQRVYILENDLEESRKKVQIVDDETSF